MLDRRSRCCCNCRRCIRKYDDETYTGNYCEIDGHYIGYLETFDGWCKRWAAEKGET